MVAFYQESRLHNDRLKRISVKRIKPQGQKPCLKVSAGQLRALVPFFTNLVNGWQSPGEEVVLLKAATNALQQCYNCLSTGPEAPPVEVLNIEAVRFAQALITLEAMNGDRYTVPPKLHMFLELAREGVRPSMSWTYRDEDF
eukprot:2904355-Amphidinium_carterae.1